MSLNPKQRAFADEYIITGNAIQSAIKAGYSEKYAKAQSYKLLENVGISDYIANKTKPVTEKRDIDIQERLYTLLDLYDGKTIVSHSKQIDHLDNDAVIKDMTYEFTPDVEMRIKAMDVFMKYASPLLEAQSKKTEVEIQLAKAKLEQLQKLNEPPQDNEVDSWKQAVINAANKRVVEDHE